MAEAWTAEDRRDFNSIKVRLEPKFRRYRVYRDDKFQFHKGAIRTIQTDNFNDKLNAISIP